jgi:DNA-binding MarR family transcriptional regulator
MEARKNLNIDYSALAEFRYEIRRFLNFSERAAHAAGIEPRQHQALLVIRVRPHGSHATIGVLAERLYIQHNSAVELSRRLEAKGWIRRVRSRADAREVLLALTPRGKRKLERISLSHHQELRTAGPRLLRALGSAIARDRQAAVLETSRPEPGRTNRGKARGRAG